MDLTKQPKKSENKKNDPKSKLPPVSIGHMPVQTRFNPNSLQQLAEQKNKKLHESKLGNRPLEQKSVAGRYYPTANLTEYVDLIVQDLTQLYFTGSKTEALSEIAILPEDIVCQTTEQMLAQLSTEDADQYKEFILEIIQKCPFNTRLQHLKNNFPPVSKGLDLFKTVIKNISGKAHLVADKLKKQDDYKKLEDWSIADQILQNKLITLIFLFKTSEERLSVVDQLFLDYVQTGAELLLKKIEQVLNDLVVLLDQQVQEVQSLINQNQAQIDEESLHLLITQIKSGQNYRNYAVAQRIRDIYEKTHGRIIIHLQDYVLEIVNDSLIVLEKVGLTERFKDKESDSGDLNLFIEFVTHNYELLNEKNNLKIALQFIENILQKDKQELMVFREQVLEDAKDVEKFFDEYIKKMQEFYKRLTTSREQRVLNLMQVRIWELKNILTSFINNKLTSLIWAKWQLQTIQWGNVKYILLAD